jgi:hypothetical protein
MPTQTSDLFLLDDLEEVGRTSALADGDLDVLRAVADWIKTFVVTPHEDLGRAGPLSLCAGGPRTKDALARA